MPSLPFLIPLNGTLSANGTLQLSFQVPSGQKYLIDKLVQVSTSTFNIIDIVDSDGMRYTSATQSNGLPNTLLKDGADNYHGVNPFETPIEVGGGKTLYIELLDTSGSSNTVSIGLTGQRIIP